MLVYLDAEYRCYTQQNEDGTLTPYEVDEFNGKCRVYVEGMRYVPEGETWVREDGEVFTGAMACPAKDMEPLEAAQRTYEDALSYLQPQLDDVFVAMVGVEV